jgi:hypothetical protein
MSRRAKPTVLEPPVIPVALNGRNGHHPAPSAFFLAITCKRGQTVRLRLSAIAAVWEDRGALDGPFFVQVAGRTFHPNEASFAELEARL